MESAAVVSRYLPIAEIVLRGYCLGRMLKPFLEKRRAAFVVGVYIFGMAILYFLPWLTSPYRAYNIGGIAALIVLCRVDGKRYAQKVFLMVTFTAVSWLCASMAEILNDNLYNYLTRTGYMQSHPEWDFALYIGSCLLYLFLEFLFTILSIRLVQRAYKHKHTDMDKREMLMLIIPSCMGLSGFQIIRYYRLFYMAKTTENIEFYDGLSLLYGIASVVTVVIVIRLYQSIRAKQEETIHTELLAAQMDNIRQHIRHLEQSYKDVRGIRHDMANHILTLEKLYEEGRLEEARAYGNDLKSELTVASEEIKSGNPVTDVIIRESKTRAEKEGIHFLSRFFYPAGSHIKAFDVSVILHNALQNALENVTKDSGAFILVESYRRNNAFMIEVSNSFSGTLRPDGENGLPATSKENVDGHGYGLSNIRRVAGKYAGDMEITVKDGKFCLCVLLMLE